MQTPAYTYHTSSPPRNSGFTLVEVILAIGVVATAVVPLVALLPIGMDNARKAVDVTVVSQIGQKLIMEAQETDFSKLKQLSTASSKLHLDDQGNKMENQAFAIYEVSYSVSSAADQQQAAGKMAANLGIDSTMYNVVELSVLNLKAPRNLQNPHVFTAVIANNGY